LIQPLLPSTCFCNHTRFVQVGWRKNSVEHPGNRSGHKISHCPCQHRAQAQAAQIAPSIRRKSTDAADLNPNRTQVRETTERKSRNREGTRVEYGSLWPEQGEKVTQPVSQQHTPH